jgi:hypothetical protein
MESFTSFKERQYEYKTPSSLITKEIIKWDILRKTIRDMSVNQMKKNKTNIKEAVQGFVGESGTSPLARAYESHPDRTIFLNPIFNHKKKSFPLWNNIMICVDYIDMDKYPSVKKQLMASIEALIRRLKSLDLKELDNIAEEFDTLYKERKEEVIENAIRTRSLLTNTLTPDKFYAEEFHSLLKQRTSRIN